MKNICVKTKTRKSIETYDSMSSSSEREISDVKLCPYADLHVTAHTRVIVGLIVVA